MDTSSLLLGENQPRLEAYKEEFHRADSWGFLIRVLLYFRTLGCNLKQPKRSKQRFIVVKCHLYFFVLLIKEQLVRDFFASRRYLTKRKDNEISLGLGHEVEIESYKPRKLVGCACVILHFYLCCIFNSCRRARTHANDKQQQITVYPL